MKEKPKPRMCSVHPEVAYTQGCKNCLAMMCVDCLSKEDICAG